MALRCFLALRLLLEFQLATFLIDHAIAAAPSTSATALMQACTNSGNGQVDITEGGQPVLRYNYQTVQPGDDVTQVRPENRKYAQPRSDYIHPLYGLDGQTLTKDWSVDHPHHRGIYWAWPEVTYRGELGDLHALQRVFARPTGRCGLQSGPLFAEVDAENVWLWEDRQPIVTERAIIRVYRASPEGRCIDLELRFQALGEDVAIARRGTDEYGGLNLRLAAVQKQEITFHTDPAGCAKRQAWGDLSGLFDSNGTAAGLTVLQNPANFDYPGDWVQFPELNWFQPTFPAAGSRYVLKKDQPLVVQFRLWVHRGGKPGEQLLADRWNAYSLAVGAPKRAAND